MRNITLIDRLRNYKPRKMRTYTLGHWSIFITESKDKEISMQIKSRNNEDRIYIFKDRVIVYDTERDSVDTIR